MFFSEKFNVDVELLKEYGAVDISLVCDMPLFIDPMLIFNSKKAEYKQLHEDIIKFFHFLYTKAQKGLNNAQIKAWFNFSEVPNNWLGYSLVGNKGLALGWEYAKFLYQNISFAIQNNNISQSSHIEKIMLLYDGSGKDKISDLTVNLIKKFLVEYTQSFALEHIDKSMLKKTYVEKAYFSYDTESFVSGEYILPTIINSKGQSEYILLTPSDILREDEPSINKKDFYDRHEQIRNAIDNDSLKVYVSNHIINAVNDYEERQRRNKKPIKEKSINKIEKEAFKEIVKEYPELYDYYVKLRELDVEEIQSDCKRELKSQLNKFVANSKLLIELFEKQGYTVEGMLTAREEAKKRLVYFKHIIEDCDGYKNLYNNGENISNENDLQRLFRFVWYGTTYKVDYEANNGRGQTDMLVSKGANDQNIIEFKLASNSKLAHIFTQVKIYEKANCAEGSLIVIFFFSQEEYTKAKSIIKNAGYKDKIDEAIFLIDCRNDNKKSASIA